MSTEATTEDFSSPTLDELAESGGLQAPDLHPSTQALLRRMSRYGGLTDRVSVGSARRRMSSMMPMVAARPSVASVVDRRIPGPGGPVPIRIVTPHGGRAPRAALVWFAGGGFVLGDLSTAEPTARSLAARTGAVVICVDYRKAPEHDIHDAYDDALAAVRWVVATADGLGVDPTRIGVGGDSAGGNVAAVVAQEYSAEADVPLAVQVLVYPSLSGEHEPARARNAHGGALDLTAMRWFEGHVAGAIDPHSTRYSPMTTADLSALPPAVIVTAGHDPLRDEGIVYLDRLRQAGVRSEHLHYPDEVHGFFAMDLILDNAVHAMDATAERLLDLLRLDGEGARNAGRQAALQALLLRQLRVRSGQLSYLVDQAVRLQAAYQRRLMRLMRLPNDRDVEALEAGMKRLEAQVRALRRQLERATTDRPPEPPRA
ncbi:alpha/beta hydrolase [Trujillonella humicola]|uniref:alpha/beta hydrolase n=1 Tax=Trujillonella humicola TaxID=3383699 RepID=UPI00390623B1